MDCSQPGSSVNGILQEKSTRVGCHSLLQGDLPNPGIEPGSPALQADSLPSEPSEEVFFSPMISPCACSGIEVEGKSGHVI